MARQRWAVVVLAVALVGVGLSAAEPAKDTTAAAFTRTKKLKGKVTVEAKNQPLSDILEDISGQLQDLKLGPISPQYDATVSKNQRTSLNVKDLPADEALAKLFESLDLGYYVVSQENSRYDGWIKIERGNARGYEPGKEPKDAAKPTDPKKPEVKPETKPDSKPTEPVDEDEKAAVSKLESAKKLIADKKADDAAKLLKYVTKFYPKTKAAEEAKKLLDEMK
jgi:TolA-binding protein